MTTDDGFEDDLRDRFSDALEDVQPSPDLYRRAEARVHRRNSARRLASVAAVALVLAAGVVAVNASDRSSGRVQVDPVASPPSDQHTDEPPDDPIDEATDDSIDAPSDDSSDKASEQPTEEPTDEPEPSEDPPVEGDPYSGPPIIEGTALAVIGVDADDVLNVRAAPGTDHDIVATLEPLADDFTATGGGRLLDGAVWVEVDTSDAIGWVHAAFVAHAAATDDVTSQVIEDHGSRPRAEAMVELAEVVAGLRATQEPPSRVVISDGPRTGDLGEVTVDVVGFGDDAVRAERLVVFATADDDGSFTLRSVEATTYCARGVTDEELCL